MLKRFRIRKRALILAASAGVLALAVLAVLPILVGRTHPPFYTKQAAEKAVLGARAARAGEWAFGSLRDAEVCLEEGLLEYRRQEVRFISLRNYEDARIHLRLAREKAERARDLAVALEGEARQSAEEALQEAETALSSVEDLSDSIRMDRPARRHLQDARAKVAQARVYFADGDVRRAHVLAVEALENAQESTRGAVRLAARYVDADQVRRWRSWVEETVAWSRRTGGAAIIVYKEKKVLTLLAGGSPVATYRADMGKNSLHNKLRAGDDATPEGRYHVVTKSRGASKYYKALLLNYPNEEDRRRIEAARRRGEVSSRAHPGGLIEVHGEGGRGEDWTNGCVALSNADMDDVFARVSVGTPITIVGGDGSNGVYSNIVRSLSPSGNPSGL